ncbi:MAG: hypothetical protein FWG31_08950 [Oscillospiraceae bacterium]|nr:hypothetical protein [Oscillospiraceae bacterium]
MKKRVLTFAIAIALVTMFAFPALAATQDLPKEGMGVGGGSQVQFVTDGKDGIKSPMTIEQFKTATAIVFEMEDYDWGAVILGGGKGNGHSNPGWALQIDDLSPYFKDGKLTLNFKALGIDVTTFSGDGSDEDFFACYIGRWNGQDGYNDMGITKAYLVYEGGGGGGGGAKKSGDGTMIALAIAALALAAGATVFFVRKVKA